MGNEQSPERRTEYFHDEDAVAAAGRRVREEEYANRIISTVRPKLNNYKIGDMIGIYEFQSRRLDTTDMKDMNILVVGPTGAGKTCLIWMLQKMFGQPPSAVTQAEGGEGTIRLESFLENHDGKFKVIDSRGFFDPRDSIEELKDILSGKLQPNDLVTRDYDKHPQRSTIPRDEAPLPKQIHSLICVLDFDDPRFSQFETKMDKFREIFKHRGYSPVSVTTYKRKITLSEEEKKKKREEAAAAYGSSIDRTFIINNYLASEDQPDPVGDAALLEVLETALIGAEMFVKTKKLEMKRQEKEQKQQSPESFMRQLQQKYKWSDQDVCDLNKLFHDEDIGTMAALKEDWSSLKSKVRKWGVADAISNELEM